MRPYRFGSGGIFMPRYDQRVPIASACAFRGQWSENGHIASIGALQHFSLKRPYLCPYFLCASQQKRRTGEDAHIKEFGMRSCTELENHLPRGELASRVLAM